MISPKRTTYLIEHRMGNEVLLYDPVASRTHRLNASATVIWEHCDGGHSLEELARTLTECFDVVFDTALDDTRAAIRQLAEEQLIAESSVGESDVSSLLAAP